MNDSQRNEFYAKLLRGEIEPPYHSKEEAISNLAGNLQEVGYACAFAIERALTIRDDAQREQAVLEVRRKASVRRADVTDVGTTRMGVFAQLKWISGR